MTTFDPRETWEHYVQSWKTTSSEERQALFGKALTEDNCYTDPVAQTNGLDELSAYMEQFHEQYPGCYFETTHFQAHNLRSIARWDMKNADGEVLGDGMSYATYNEAGMITAETGFYEIPQS